MTAVTKRSGQRHQPADKVALGFDAIAARVKAAPLPTVDLVVAIATGGIVPGALVAYELGVPLHRLDINYRAPDNTPQRPAPQLLASPDLPAPGSRVLLVDDVAVTGQTLALAGGLLSECDVTTLTLKGRAADIVLFPEVASCVAWPWNAEPSPG